LVTDKLPTPVSVRRVELTGCDERDSVRPRTRPDRSERLKSMNMSAVRVHEMHGCIEQTGHVKTAAAGWCD